LIRDIARYSFAKVDRGSNSIQVHRLIQVAIRGQMEPRQYREDTRSSRRDPTPSIPCVLEVGAVE